VLVPPRHPASMAHASPAVAAPPSSRP
jgi:hypothetical protein